MKASVSINPQRPHRCCSSLLENFFVQQLLIYGKINLKLRYRKYLQAIFALSVVVITATSLLWVSYVVNYVNNPTYPREIGWRSVTRDSTEPRTVILLDKNSEPKSFEKFQDAFMQENLKFMKLQICQGLSSCKAEFLKSMALDIDPPVMVALTIYSQDNYTINIGREKDFDLVVPFVYRMLNYDSSFNLLKGKTKISDYDFEFIRFESDNEGSTGISPYEEEQNAIKEMSFAFFGILLLFGSVFVFLFDCKIFCILKETYFLDFLYQNGLFNSPIWIYNFFVVGIESALLSIASLTVILHVSSESVDNFSFSSSMHIFIFAFFSNLLVANLCYLVTIAARRHNLVTLVAIGISLLLAVFILILSIVFSDGSNQTMVSMFAYIPTVFVGKIFHKAYEQGEMSSDEIAAMCSTALVNIPVILLILYLDNILPNGNGLRLGAFYPIKKKYWLPYAEKSFGDVTECSNISEGLDSNVEAVTGFRPVLKLNNVDVVYCKKSNHAKKAVDSFSGTFYENQITCLLGHNGAGKTSLINVLIGKHSPSNGFATIDDISVTDRLSRLALRGTVGICEQFEVLSPHITVQESIDFLIASNYDSTTAIKDKEEASNLLEALQLEQKVDTCVKFLSGGQKRKLSTILALMGNPRVVFLDEPTSGMDPVARRYLWNVLQSYKNERTIILSTHYMDEADILADRKLFLASGKLICGGSSMFLKHAFDCGTLINITARSSEYTEDIAENLLAVEPTAEVQRQENRSLIIKISMDSQKSLTSLVRILEKDSHRVASFELKPTALDEVFMKLKDMTPEDILAAFQKKDRATKDETDAIETQEAKSDNDLSEEDKSHTSFGKCKFSFINQLKAQFSVNLLRLVRRKKTIVSRIVLPVLLMAFIGLARLLDENLESVRYALRTSITKTIYPTVIDLYGMKTHHQENAVYFLDVAGENCKRIKKNEETLKQMIEKINPETFRCSKLIKEPPAPGKLVTFSYISSKNNRIVIGYKQSGKKTLSYGATVLLSGVLNICRTYSDKCWTASTVDIYFPYIRQFYLNCKIVFYVILIALIPVTYFRDPIDDRLLKVRQQLTAMGISPLAYWSSTLILHYTQFCVIFLLASAVLIGISPEEFWNVTMIVGVFLPVILIGLPSNLLFVYFIGRVFAKPQSSLSQMLFFIQLTLAFVSIAIVIDDTTQFVLPWIWPPYATVLAIFSAAKLNERLVTATSAVTPTELLSLLFQHRYFLNSFVAMVVHLLLFAGFLFMLEYWSIIYNFLKKNIKLPVRNKRCITITRQEDELNEIVLSRKTSTENTSVMDVRQLTKIYDGNLLAVDGINLQVMTDEILILVGPTGSGKSSTLSMLVGEILPTTGSCTVATEGTFLSSQEAARKGELGYCPQHNPLFPEVTVEELLLFYARIRGVLESEVQKQVDYLMKNLCLEEHRSKKTCELSGGNKRRLCLGVAMLGRPSLLVIDEVSTGVDPGTMRSIWNSIKGYLSPTKGVILSTHSMEEAEALASNIAVINKGKVLASGSLQELKKSHGQNYTVQVLFESKMSIEVETAKQQFIPDFQQRYNNAVVMESIMDTMELKLPKSEVPLVSHFLEWFTANISEWGIIYFTFFEETMDQVFVNLVKANDQNLRRLSFIKNTKNIDSELIEKLYDSQIA